MENMPSGVVRVVVSGVGAITSQGRSAEVFWEGVRTGKVAIRPVRGLPMDGYQTRIGGEVTETRGPPTPTPRTTRSVSPRWTSP